MTINIASSQIIIVPEEAHHCVHQHWAMGSLPFPSPIRHQGQFQGAGHKAWIMGHLVDVSRQTPSGLCIWDLFSSELRGQIQVQLAVNRNMNFRIIFLLQLILFLWTIACDLSSKTKLFEYLNENYFLHGIWQSSHYMTVHRTTCNDKFWSICWVANQNNRISNPTQSSAGQTA